jgi:DNA-binding MarR family transcriptional regulator
MGVAHRLNFRFLKSNCCTAFKDHGHAPFVMLNLKLEELPMPTSDRSIDRLIGWFVESFCFVRRKGDATADYGSASPIHRMLRDHFIAHPTTSWDAQSLSDELAMTPAALNHHLARLSQSGLLSYTNEGKGWRTYILRGGGLSQALELCFAQYRLILEQKMDLLQANWSREGIALDNELSEESPLPLNMSIIDYRSSQEGASNLTQWMADFGLLGDRPGNEILADSVSEQLFQLLLRTGTPISLDDAHEQFGGQKARLGRILERFRACGLVERIPRTDRLATALWSAMVTQHQRRGEDWLLKKGGFMRLIPEKNHASLLQPLGKGALTIELVQEAMQSIDASDQMLLLNLLGGRLPLGYRLVGATLEDSKVNMTARLDRLLRRIRRVGTMIEDVMTTGDA